jgi:lysophospholipase L1-like esterase
MLEVLIVDMPFPSPYPLRLVALLAFALAIALAPARVGIAQAAPAPVPCVKAGGGHYDCEWYRAGDGHSGGTPVRSGEGTLVGYLHQGTNWVVCQQRGGRRSSADFYNSWWAWTEADDGRWGWVNAVWAKGGDNDGQFGGGVPQCAGVHGAPPGASDPTAPNPAPQPTPAPSPAPSGPPPLPHYVALGDSYSSGEGAGSYYGPAPGRPARCDRSRNAYSQLLAKRLAGRYQHSQTTDFLACSGDEVPDLLTRQVPRIPADTRLITVGIGGNDSGWIDIVKSCMSDAASHPGAGGKGCNTIISERFKTTLPRLRARLDQAYDAIRAKAPDATVIALGYPAIFEDSYASEFCASVGALTRGARSDLRSGAAKLDRAIKDVAAAHGFRWVDPTSAYKHHRICSSGADWLHGVTRGSGLSLSPQTFHPNADGQKGFAHVIEDDNKDLFG